MVFSFKEHGWLILKLQWQKFGNYFEQISPVKQDQLGQGAKKDKIAKEVVSATWADTHFFHLGL